MPSERLRQGQEVLEQHEYLRMVRSGFAVRIGAWLVTAVWTTPESGLAWVLLLASVLLSAWATVDPRFAVTYVRHPAVALVDTFLVVSYVVIEPRHTLGSVVLAVAALVAGLLLGGWLALPTLTLLLAAVVAVPRTGAAGGAGADVMDAFFSVGLPMLVVGLVAVGWMIRHTAIEAHRSRVALQQEHAKAQQEAERARLARDMHDSLGKTLHGINLATTALQRALSTGDHRSAACLASDIEAASRTAAEEGRSILRGLRRHQLDRPLAEAVGELARRHSASGIDIRTHVEGLVELCPVFAAEALSVVEEALDNVLRHSGARRAEVRLVGDGSTARLVVSDDGRGFDPAAVDGRERAGHFGLRGMRERVEATGGRWDVVTAPGAGTRVECRWPVRITQEAR